MEFGHYRPVSSVVWCCSISRGSVQLGTRQLVLDAGYCDPSAGGCGEPSITILKLHVRLVR